MAFFVSMPKLGMTMTEGTVSEWKKKEGDAVATGEALFDVETDKLTNTVNSYEAGTLLKILVHEGETADCQAPVAIMGQAGEDISGMIGAHDAHAAESPTQTPAAQAEQAPAHKAGERLIISPRAKKVAAELGIDPHLITGTGPNGRIVERDVRAYKPAAKADDGVKASPLAKKVAEDIGIDLANVPGNGRVMAADILQYLKSGNESAQAAPAAREETVNMDGMRKAIARNMLNSHMTSPTVTFEISVDMTNLKAYRAQLKANDIKVSYTDILVKFVAKALTEFPALNCSVDGNSIIYKHYVNMGVAVALDNGLVVPNVQDADKKSLTEISNEVKELAELARAGKLPMERLHGGTFTITNLGMYGIESFSPIINQPEVAILGVCAMQDMPVVVDGQVAIRTMMKLCLTADHRVVDGALAAQFMHRIKTLMENPALMLA